jgi:hypothetical protein
LSSQINSKTQQFNGRIAQRQSGLFFLIQNVLADIEFVAARAIPCKSS